MPNSDSSFEKIMSNTLQSEESLQGAVLMSDLCLLKHTLSQLQRRLSNLNKKVQEYKVHTTKIKDPNFEKLESWLNRLKAQEGETMHNNFPTLSSMYHVDQGFSNSDTVGTPQTKLRQLHPQTTPVYHFVNCHS